MEIRMDIQKILSQLEQVNATISMFADGYVDEVWELVSSRQSMCEYAAINKKRQLAERIMMSGTGGMAIEIVKKRRTIGGFTANIGFATAKLGVDTILIGFYGKESIDSLYEPLNNISSLISLGDPAVTHALEFNDGKILLTHLEAVSNVQWSHIVDALGIEEIVSILTNSDVIGVGYWSSMLAFDDMLAEIYALLPQDNKSRLFFFDFADFRKRDMNSLAITLQKFKSLNEKCPIILSVNEHEGAVLFQQYNETFDELGGTIPQKAESVREKLGIAELVIHTPYFAIVSSCTDGVAMVPQRYCEKPFRTAGAGDSFNGGYLAAKLAGLEVSERLYLANETVSYFLHHGNPPSQRELVDWCLPATRGTAG